MPAPRFEKQRWYKYIQEIAQIDLDTRLCTWGEYKHAGQVAIKHRPPVDRQQVKLPLERFT
jgi:hypothetical protein